MTRYDRVYVWITCAKIQVTNIGADVETFTVDLNGDPWFASWFDPSYVRTWAKDWVLRNRGTHPHAFRLDRVELFDHGRLWKVA